MKILYVASKYDYGESTQGYSYEHENFYDCLSHLGHDILYYDAVAAEREVGRRRSSQRLLELATRERPRLMFCVLMNDELEWDAVQSISDLDGVTTCNWFCDDHWRFESFSRHWAPAFNWAVTTDAMAVGKYRAIGYSRVLKSQWGVNPFRYERCRATPEYDVTFVGKPHGVRRQIVRALADRGIRVMTWGLGWPSGRVSQEEMMRIFATSKINLNLSAASCTRRRRWQRAVDNGRRTVARLLQHPAWDGAARLVAADARLDQIKGRDFEVPACGGFLLTAGTAALGDYYAPGREVATYRGLGDLVRRIEYYLGHDDKRTAIAKAGYRRTIAQHTYVQRFGQIFRSMGLVTDEQVPRAAG